MACRRLDGPRRARHHRAVWPRAAPGADRQPANLCLSVRAGRGPGALLHVGKLIVKKAKARIPVIAIALVAVIAVFWFLSISRLGNTGFQKFAEAKQRESARADRTITEVEPGPDDHESPIPRGLHSSTDTVRSEERR